MEEEKLFRLNELLVEAYRLAKEFKVLNIDASLVTGSPVRVHCRTEFMLKILNASGESPTVAERSGACYPYEVSASLGDVEYFNVTADLMPYEGYIKENNELTELLKSYGETAAKIRALREGNV